jgi:hypothetical protein
MRPTGHPLLPPNVRYAPRETLRGNTRHRQSGILPTHHARFPASQPGLPSEPGWHARQTRSLTPYPDSEAASWQHGAHGVTGDALGVAGPATACCWAWSWWTPAASPAVRLALQVGRGGPLVVTGPSGAGRSSLLRAGLLPALAAGDLPIEGSAGWSQLYLRPGVDPFVELAR